MGDYASREREKQRWEEEQKKEWDWKNSKIKTVEQLDSLIGFMHTQGFFHTKRKYKLNTATLNMAVAHEVEETVEFMCAAIAFEGCKLVDRAKGKYNLMLEEAADKLLCSLHSHMLCGLRLEDIVNRAAEKAKEIFIPEDPNG